MPHEYGAAAVVSLDDGTGRADDCDGVALGPVSLRDDCAVVRSGRELNGVASFSHLHRFTESHGAGAIGRDFVDDRVGFMTKSRN